MRTASEAVSELQRMASGDWREMPAEGLMVWVVRWRSWVGIWEVLGIWSWVVKGILCNGDSDRGRVKKCAINFIFVFGNFRW